MIDLLDISLVVGGIVIAGVLIATGWLLAAAWRERK